MYLDGKRIAVFGAGPGLGSAAAYFMLNEGARVAVTSRSKERADSIVAMLKQYGEVVGVAGDASSDSGAGALVSGVESSLGGIDHAFINIGNFLTGKTEEMNEDKINEMFSANLKTPLMISKYLAGRLHNGSSMVFVSSSVALFKAKEGQIAYSSAKAGLAKAVEILAHEFINKGVRVNAVAPNSMHGDFKPGRDYKSMRKIGDAGCASEDVAKIVVWLMGDDAYWINGVTIPIDGGARLLS